MTQKQLQQLKAKWERKLKASGFKDIETTHPDRLLKHWDSIEFQRYHTPDSFKQRERYYQLAGHMLHGHKFKSKRDQAIWRDHCEGKSYPEIAKKRSISVTTVFVTIKRYAAFIKKTT